MKFPPITLVLILVACAISVFISLSISNHFSKRREAKAVEAAKVQSVREVKLRDSLKYVTGMLKSLEGSYLKRGDTLQAVRKEKGKERVIIRTIYPELLSDSALTARFKRFYPDLYGN